MDPKDILQLVAQIPPGQVTSYGRIAASLGQPQASRYVARVLANCPPGLGIPCHRVVNSQGRLAPNWEEQALLLEMEGHVIMGGKIKDFQAKLYQV